MSLTKSSASNPQIKIYKILLVKYAIKRQPENGFTLIELLVALVITSIIILISGTGLLFVLNANAKSEAQVTQQSNLRRASEFISDEVKAASVITNTYPVWFPSTTFLTGINPVDISPIPVLFLEIPIAVDCIKAISPSTTLTTLIVPNHGLVKGSAVRFSGNNLSAVGITNNKTTYYVATVSSYLDTVSPPTLTNCNNSPVPTVNTNNAFTLVDENNVAVSFTATPQNFAVRRLVTYYTATPDQNQWKAPKTLYRATGNCSATTFKSDPLNCLVMIDSLIEPVINPNPLLSKYPFSATTANRRTTLTFNGQLCVPTSMANTCNSPDYQTISVDAFSRATLN